MNPQKSEIIKPFKTRQEMAKELGISVRTLQRKLKKKNIILSSGLLNLSEQNKIYQAFGLLDSLETSEKKIEMEKE